MKKRIITALFFLTIFSTCTSVSGEVVSTQQPTAQDAVYVAGNPDLYPLEFYNEKTDRYEGILPGLYEEISRQTGIDFSYVSAGSDRQKELGENFQVEIVSAYRKGAVSLSKEIELFSYEQDGKTETVCIGFTKIIEPAVASAVENALQSTDKATWLSAAMTLETQAQPSRALPWLIGTLCLLAVAVVVLAVYIIKKHRLSEQQRQTKMIDALTGIGNLKYFEDCYTRHISDAMRPLYYVAYMAIDIEKIETYFGQAEAEEVQRYAANTIAEALGEQDFAGRIDEGVFALCFMCPDAERALKKAEEVIGNLNRYNDSEAKEHGTLFRGGVFPLEKQNITVETAVYNARQGYLYAVSEKQTVCLSDEKVLDRVTLKSRLQKKISAAIEKEEFHLYLQFISDTRSRAFCGAEVLSRWHNLEDGVLSPANYIEDMKIAGMIDRLDFYVFEKTCQVLSDWKGGEFEKLRLSCNFTRTTLSKPDFSEQFEEIISKYDFDRENLLVELTEDSLVDDSAIAYKSILAIKKLGCKIALDDFGSGYTSFSDLCDYPIDIIKIDRGIVLKAASHRGYAVLTGIIRMAHDLGIEVLCEGVETEAENQKVLEAESDYIQGFFYSRVLPLENAVDFYKEHH